MKLGHFQENEWTGKDRVEWDKPDWDRQVSHVCAYLRSKPCDDGDDGVT
jgi:hypothetical protein